MVAWRRQLTAAYTFLAVSTAPLSSWSFQHESSLSHPCRDSYPYLLKSSFSLSPSLTDEWQVQDRLPSSDYPMDLRFSLRPQPENTRILEEVLFSNHPSHPLWTHRKHLSKDEVARLAAPHRDSVERFQMYLARHGVNSTSLVYSEEDISRATATLPRVSVQLAERLLGTRYRVYENAKTGREIIRATEYSLPADVHGDIDWVQPTNYFGKVTTYRRTSHIEPPSPVTGNELSFSDAVSNSTHITLSVLKDIYNFAHFTPTANSSITKNLLGIAGYLEEYANLNDLREFYRLNLPKAVKTTLEVVKLNGAINSQNASEAGSEAVSPSADPQPLAAVESELQNLDVQYAGGISCPIPNIFYSTSGRGHNTQPNISYHDNENEPYDVLLSYLLSLNDSALPLTLSTSYGEEETDVPLDYARSICLRYGLLGARGVSVIHSSGDWGVGVGPSNNPNFSCPTQADGSGNRFRAVFPASCPYVTAVGGTYLVPETTNALSGGGFSDYFERPRYQDAAVKDYLLELGSTYKGMYNASGRGFPDISAQSHNFRVVVGGTVKGISGTSAAAPVVAGIITLLNDVLISLGRQPLGFLNPFLYSLALGGLNDITTGSNPGCGTNGFIAATGWDPATGNGTPNFTQLRQIVSSPGYTPTGGCSRRTHLSILPDTFPTSLLGSAMSIILAIISL